MRTFTYAERPDLAREPPLIPLERYAWWTREDALPFDPWLRMHARLGAELLEVCPASMRIEGTTDEGTTEEWESWAGMAFPGDGDYAVPGALTPIRFSNGRGVYVEPNVWMRHPVQA